MFGPRIKLDKALYDRAVAAAKTVGYSSVDEFLANLLEKELAKIEKPLDANEKLEERLRGLGYIE